MGFRRQRLCDPRDGDRRTRGGGTVAGGRSSRFMPGSTVGADKGYDVASFVADVRVRDVTPHVAQKVRWSAIDGRTTRHAGYRRESAETNTRGTGLWVDEDRRWFAQASGIAASHSSIGSITFAATA